MAASVSLTISFLATSPNKYDIDWQSVLGDFFLTLTVALLAMAAALQADCPLQAVLVAGTVDGLVTAEEGSARCAHHKRRVSMYGLLGLVVVIIWVLLWVLFALTTKKSDSGFDVVTLFILGSFCIGPALLALSVSAILVGCLSVATPSHALHFPEFYRLLARRVYLFALPLLLAHFIVTCFFGFLMFYTLAFNLAVALALFIRLRLVIPLALTAAGPAVGMAPSLTPSPLRSLDESESATAINPSAPPSHSTGSSYMY